MKKWGIYLLLLISVVVITVLAWQWLKPSEQTAYLTETVKRETISQTVSATGEITPSHWVEVGAQASGQIKKLYVKLGQVVKKGDLIAEIDATSQVNALNTHKAKLETYQAQLQSAQIALGSANKKWQREQALWREQATSKEALEAAQDALAAAKAQVVELRSAIKQTQIAINTAETDVGYTKIVAPFDGTVVAVPVEEGQTVNANQTTPTIIQLADLSMMLNKMQISEGDVTKVKAGQAVSFNILSEPDNVLRTTLDSVDPALTTMSQGSYSHSTDNTENAIYYYARAYIPNADGKLFIGMTTQNTIEISSVENVLSIPSIAVKRQGNKSVVRVLKEGKVEEREVKTGLKDGVRVEVKSGLKEGEEVIVSEMSETERQEKQNQQRMPRL